MLRRPVGTLLSSRNASRLALPSAGFTYPLASAKRTFYDKVRKEREGSDVGPNEMFADFPRNPNAQKVPELLHKGNREAVDSAERLNVIFLMSLVLLLIGLGYFLDPFNEDQYERPNKFVPKVEPIEKVPPVWASKP